MTKIIVIGIILVVIIVGVYVFVKDTQIKRELETVERSEFSEGAVGVQNSNEVDSQITIVRTNGEWNITETGEYTLDPSSLIFEFTGYKPGGFHTGTFNAVTANVSLDADGVPVTSSIVFDVASVVTDSAGVDKHLQAPEFFDAANSPQITVEIKGMEKRDDQSYLAIADITMSGQTKTLSIPVQMGAVEGGVSFAVDTKIKISEYGMAYGPVQDDVRIVAKGVLKKK